MTPNFKIPKISTFIWVVVVLLVFLLINIRGVEIATRQAPFKLDGFIMAIAVSIFLFIGFEWVTPLSEEADDRRYGIPRAMPIAISILAICYIVFTLMMIIYVPLAQLKGNPVPHMIFARILGGRTTIIIIGLISILASLTSFNAGIMGISRLVYALAREKALPKWLSRIHLTYATPWTALIFLFLLTLCFSLIVALTGQYLIPILLAATIECLIYAVIGLVVIRLRKVQPSTHAVSGSYYSFRWLDSVLYLY